MADTNNKTKEMLQVAVLVDRQLASLSKVDKEIKELRKIKTTLRYWDQFGDLETDSASSYKTTAENDSGKSALIKRLESAYELPEEDSKLFIPSSLLTERKLELILDRVGPTEINGEAERSAVLFLEAQSGRDQDKNSAPTADIVEVTLNSLQASEKIVSAVMGNSKITQEQLMALAENSESVLKALSASTKTKDEVLENIVANRTITEIIQLVKDNQEVYQTLFDTNGMPLLKPALPSMVDDSIKASYNKVASCAVTFLAVTASTIANFEVVVDYDSQNQPVKKVITEMSEKERLSAVNKHELLTLLLVDKDTKLFKKDLNLDTYLNQGYSKEMVADIKKIYLGGGNDEAK